MDARPFINLFNGKLRVKFINATTGKLIGVKKMKVDQLPDSFNKPTFILFNGEEWRVMKAEPVNASEYTLDNKLTLHVESPSSILLPLGHNYPTICNEFPSVSSTEPIEHDFYLDLQEENWRQFEILPLSILPAVKEQIDQIISILSSSGNANSLHGYFDIHTRTNTRQKPLNISYESFCEQMNISQRGAIRIGQGRFVKNGFALKSDNYTYYGIQNDGIIEELNLESFESMDEEFFNLVLNYEVLLADWCGGNLIMA
jgi:hypothetical protein